MIKEDGQVLHFNNPKVQASLAANTFAVTGHAENKRTYLKSSFINTALQMMEVLNIEYEHDISLKSSTDLMEIELDD